MKKLIVVLASAFALTANAADPPKSAPAAAPAAPAPAAAPAGPPPPAAELSAALKSMEGKWKCEGKWVDSAFGKAHASKGEMSMKSDLGGYFFTSRYDEKKAKDNPSPYSMSSFAGFDPSKKELVRTDLDNFGSITHLSSKGWEGDKIVWAGEVLGAQKVQFKETITKKTDKEMVTALEMAGPDGKWAPLGELVCKK